METHKGNGPPQLPPLVVGQQITNGPYIVNVTESMVAQRERDNDELAKRWQQQQSRRFEDPDDYYYGEFKDFNVRRRFVRRVFSLLTVQLIFTALVVATFAFVPEARQFMVTTPILHLVALIVFLMTYISISCCVNVRKQVPCNIVCLVLLTASYAYLTAAVSVFYSMETVFIASVSTALISLVICCTATCTKFDLTKQNGSIMIVGLVILICIFLSILTLYFTQIKVLHIVIALLGTLLVSTFLFYDVQTIMGGRMIELSPDEVIYATAQIYVDIVLLYRYFLIFFGFSDN